jgi:hypothetical protein
MRTVPNLPSQLENRVPGVCNGEVDKILRKYTSLDEMKADEYRYWQSRPAHERLDAVEEMVATAYALKGWKMEPDVPRLQRPFVRLQCPWH